MSTALDYYRLTKPGIIRGNLLAVAAGFFVASRGGNVNLALLAGTAVAITLVIASACVANNYVDKDIDKLMSRTKSRAFPSGSVSVAAALIYAAALGLAGFSLLAVFTNPLTVAIGSLAFVDYVVFYGWAKRRSWHGTLVGSLSGSAPLTAGYTAVIGRFDWGALLLFLIMACWQMPHFYSIALRRLKDYKAAGLPVLPAVKTPLVVKAQIIAFITAFVVADMLLYALGYFGRLSVIAIGVYGAVWLTSAVRGLSAANDRQWAKQLFLYSLVFLPLLFVVTLIEAWLSA